MIDDFKDLKWNESVKDRTRIAPVTRSDITKGASPERINRLDGDRRALMRWCFGLVFLICAPFVIELLINPGNFAEIISAWKSMMAVVLPILSIVVGYYFGTQQR